MKRDADPNLDYYRRVYADLQAAVVLMQRQIAALRCRYADEDVGVTTSDDNGEW